MEFKIKEVLLLWWILDLAASQFVSNPSVPCPNDTVIFTCTVNNNALGWDVFAPPESGFMDIRGQFVSTSQMIAPIGEDGFMFQVNLVNFNATTITSTLTTITEVSSLNGTRVVCEMQGILTITLAVSPSAPLNPQTVSIMNDMESSDVGLQWDSPSTLGGVPVYYVLSIQPSPLSGTPVIVETTSVVITVQYNTPYNVTIRAENCAGMSDEVPLIVDPIVACSSNLSAATGVIINSRPWIPTVGSMLMFTCADTISCNTVISSNCSSDGRWGPDPQSYVCPTTAVSCVVPDSPTNGFVVQISNTTIVFGCNEGFSLQQNQTANCLAMDQWSSKVEEILCVAEPDTSTPAPLSTGAVAGVSVAVSAVLFTILGFLAGLLVMFLITSKKAVYSPTEGQANAQPFVPVGPVYEDVLPAPKEEIELKTNNAYGPVK